MEQILASLRETFEMIVNMVQNMIRTITEMVDNVHI